jgi:OFA family oxalate/formate antiporter-like MFS transporter
MIMGEKRPRIFYGWWIVGACFLIAFYVSGIIFYGFTALFEPIANEFGWSYTQISIAASLRGLEMGLLAPLIGILVDRWGPRKLIFSGIIITGVGLVVLSRITSLGMFYGAFILVAIGISTCSGTVLMTAVANWFRRKVGMATGIMACGWGFSGLLVPVIVGLINIFDWRTAMLILGLGVWVIGLPLSLLVRHKPEQYGYLPDGEMSSSAIFDEGVTSAQTAEEDIGAKQALKSGTFWHIALALLCQAIILGAVVLHVMPYLSSIGMARATSSLVASAIPLFSISGRLGFGWLGDKLDKRRVSAGAFAAMSLGLLCFEYASTGEVWLLVPFLILFGIGYGGNSTIRASLLREYFGRIKFGTILGCAMGVMALGSMIGPPLAGWVFDNWGSYHGIWLVFAGLAAIALVLITTTSRPRSSPTKGQLRGTTTIG